MDSSGIIRRVDELGRIVIPVEIRRLMNIKVGENLEFLISKGEISLKKKSYIENNLSIINSLMKILESIVRCNYFFSDRTKIIYSSNKELINMSLSNEIMRYLDKYDEYNIIDNIIEYKIDNKIYLFPYYVDNNIAGFIGLYDVDNINEYVFVIKFVCKYIQELFTLS